MAILARYKVQVVGNEYCGYYNGWKDGNSCSGNTVKVTLRRGKEWASCAGILIWEEENAEMCFEEFKEFALAGEEGYSYWVEE